MRAAARSPYAMMALGAGTLGYAAYRGWRKRRARRVVGTPNKNIGHKEYCAGTNSTYQNLERKKLFQAVVNFGVNPKSGEKMGETRNTVFFAKGFQVQARFLNTSAFAIEVHWAIVQTRDNESFGSIAADMFRTFESDTTRQRAFIDISTNATWDIRNLNEGINKDNVNVFTHQKFLLGGNANSSETDATYIVQNDQEAPCMKKIDKYFSVGKKLRFQGLSAQDLEKRWVLLVWYETVQDVNVPLNEPLKMNIAIKGVTA